jgi:hypothetical protein
MSNVEDPGRKVHRSSQHARKWNDDRVFRWVGRIAPGIELLPPRALATDHVGPRPAQPGILDRLVCIDSNMMPRCHLGYVQIVAHHVLAGEPFTAATAVNNITAVANISRLDDLDAVIFI